MKFEFCVFFEVKVIVKKRKKQNKKDYNKSIKKNQPVQKYFLAKLSAYAKVSLCKIDPLYKSVFVQFYFYIFFPLVQKCLCANLTATQYMKPVS